MRHQSSNHYLSPVVRNSQQKFVFFLHFLVLQCRYSIKRVKWWLFGWWFPEILLKSDGHHFKVMITFWASLKSDGRKMRHYWVITAKSDHYFGHYRQKWSLLQSLPAITYEVMGFGDDYRSDDYFEDWSKKKWSTYKCINVAKRKVMVIT